MGAVKERGVFLPVGRRGLIVRMHGRSALLCLYHTRREDMEEGGAEELPRGTLNTPKGGEEVGGEEGGVWGWGVLGGIL